MMKLELGHIEHPRARKMEGDLDVLAHFVSQITNLGRLESAGRASFKPLDLAALILTVVSDIAPWVYDQNHTIAYDGAEPTWIEGDATLIEDAVRNLVENAVKHTPEGTNIHVGVGPGLAVSVTDDAGLASPDHLTLPHDRLPEGAGIGLEIIRRIMNLHRGRLEHRVEPLSFTAMKLRFEASTADLP